MALLNYNDIEAYKKYVDQAIALKDKKFAEEMMQDLMLAQQALLVEHAQTQAKLVTSGLLDEVIE